MARKRKSATLFDHNFEECERRNTAHLDECELCGELTACVCLGSIVDDWKIKATGQTGKFAYNYEYKPKNGIIFYFGYAESYRDAMDSIAHSELCRKRGA